MKAILQVKIRFTIDFLFCQQEKCKHPVIIRRKRGSFPSNTPSGSAMRRAGALPSAVRTRWHPRRS